MEQRILVIEQPFYALIGQKCGYPLLPGILVR